MMNNNLRTDKPGSRYCWWLCSHREQIHTLITGVNTQTMFTLRVD